MMNISSLVEILAILGDPVSSDRVSKQERHSFQQKKKRELIVSENKLMMFETINMQRL